MPSTLAEKVCLFPLFPLTFFYITVENFHLGITFVLTEPSQLGRSDAGMCFVFNKGTAKVSTTF